MSPAMRARALWGALAATLAAVAATAWLTEDETPAVAVRELLAARAASVPSPQPRRSGPAVLPARAAWAPVPPAALLAWGAPAPVASVPRAAPAPAPAAPATTPPPPPAPAAPPLAYRFVGRIVQEGRQHAMLLSPQGDLKVVVENEVVDGQWRVEHIAERAVDLVWTAGVERRRLAIATT